MKSAGSRVGAVMSSNKKVVKFFGFGVYEGDHIPTGDNLNGWAKTMAELKRPNPRIKLDSGKVVYGCECWWGPEEKVKTMLKGMKVVDIDIDAERAKGGEE